MKRYLPNILSVAALLLATLSATGSAGAGRLQQISVQEGAPTVISYQGAVTVDTVAYNGTGYFKFAILNVANSSTWSNDGTSVNGSEPSASVALEVTNGYFTVLLGNSALPGMSQSLTYDAFSTPDTYLRVWFSTDGTAFLKLAPDQRVAATAYAMQAEVAKQADSVGGYTGDQLSLIGHTHSGADIVTGSVGAAYIDGAIARLNQITPTVWSSAGAGSGLNADLLDGQHGSYYTGQIIPSVTAAGFITRTLADSLYGASYTAGTGLYLVGRQFNVNFAGSGSALSAARSDHKHAGTDITSTISSAYIGADIARMSQITPTVWSSAGAGSGLNADLLDGQHSAAFVGLAGTQTITGTKTFSPTSGAPFSVTSTTLVTNLNADRLDGQHAGNASGNVPLNNGTLNTNLSADLLDGQHAGNASGNVPLNNGTLNTNLNADLLDGQHSAAFVGLAGTQTITGTKTFSPTSGAPFSVTSTTLVTNLNADRLDGQHAGNASGNVPLNNGTLNTNLSADLLDGQHAGNASGNVPLNNGTLNTNLNADLLDGQHAGNAAGNVPVNNGTLNANLNADLLDGLNGAAYQLRVIGNCAVGSTIHDINADGSVVCEAHDTLPVHSKTNVDTGSYNYASIAIGADGLPLIGYYDATNKDLKVAHCDNPACTTTLNTTLDSAGDVGSYAAIAIGGDGLGLISYYDAVNGDLKVAHCSNAACTGATVSTLDSADNAGQYSSITVGTDGFGLISYYDVSTKKLRVVHCTNQNCSTKDTPTEIAASGWVDYGKYTSITIGADGYGLISFWKYYSVTDGDLAVVHCTNLACSSYDTPRILDNTGDLGSYTSITVGRDGLGIVSHWDANQGWMRVVHCSNIDCTNQSAVNIGTVAIPGDTGSTAITIGSDGFPLLLYYAMPGIMKVVHCTTLNCSNYTEFSYGAYVAPYRWAAITMGTDGMPIFVNYSSPSYTNLQVVHCSNAFCVPNYRQR